MHYTRITGRARGVDTGHDVHRHVLRWLLKLPADLPNLPLQLVLNSDAPEQNLVAGKGLPGRHTLVVPLHPVGESTRPQPQRKDSREGYSGRLGDRLLSGE